jgi:hypothetical protein
VIVILASGLDREARDLANSWKAYDARILTAEDLHRPGWAFRPDDGAQDGTCVVAGSVVGAKDIELALTCRPSVLPEELTGLHPEERQYVAAEMTAFLVAWLTSLTCPVFNRPTATSLCGPAWSVEHWRIQVVRCGGRWARTGADLRSACVIGDQCFNAPNDRLERVLRQLAIAANVRFLRALCNSESVVSVSSLPRCDTDQLRDAILRDAGLAP